MAPNTEKKETETKTKTGLTENEGLDNDGQSL